MIIYYEKNYFFLYKNVTFAIPLENVKEISSLPEAISEREKEILQHTVSGLDAKRIADILNISVFTVRKHIANIYEKLHVQSKAQIISLAHQRKWFTNDEVHPGGWLA